MPTTAALALPTAPVPTGPFNVSSAELDKVTSSNVKPTELKKQGILANGLSFHDDRLQYEYPLCDAVQMVEVDGRQIPDTTAFLEKDSLVVSVRPNAATPAKACISRVVRQKISRGASQGECLQDYQVIKDVDGEPAKYVTKYEYFYNLSIYNRPTLECDRKVYGSAPITTTVAAGKPFIITLTRESFGETKELMRWALTTNGAGKVRFGYTFGAPSDTYKFEIKPGGNAVAGDVIGWTQKVESDSASVAPVADTKKSPTSLSAAPIIGVLVFVLLVAGAAEYWHWVRKKREKLETPEQEYQRVQKL
jgi:hypothetical protein